MGKYVIESKFENTRCFLEVACENREPYFFINRVDSLTPYVEPDLEQVRKEAYEKGYETAKHECEDCPKQAYTDAIRMEGYQKGLSDAWEAARKIVDLWRDIPNDELMKIFDVRGNWGESVLSLIMRCLPPSEAIEKIRQYEQEKEEDGLRQNIQTIVDQCGYSLDEIAEVLKKMKES